MNVGFSNLDTLKKFLLPGTMQSDKTFDSTIAIIGKGVAGMFDTFCNRKFQFMDLDTIIFQGDRSHYYLPRFPLLSVATVEMRYFLADAWNNISGQPIAWNPETGLLHFGYTLGRNPLQVKVTYSGGYWFDPLEPDDSAFPSSQPDIIANPVGVTLNGGSLEAIKFNMPESIQTAWLLQCAEVWKRKDKLGVNLVDAPAEAHSREKLIDILPMVESILKPFVRYQLS